MPSHGSRLRRDAEGRMGTPERHSSRIPMPRGNQCPDCQAETAIGVLACFGVVAFAAYLRRLFDMK